MHLTHHEKLDSPLEARIFDLLSPRGTAPDAPPASNIERKRRVVCLEALYCLPGTVTRHLRAAVFEDTTSLLKRPTLCIVRGVECSYVHG